MSLVKRQVAGMADCVTTGPRQLPRGINLRGLRVAKRIVQRSRTDSQDVGLADVANDTSFFQTTITRMHISNFPSLNSLHGQMQLRPSSMITNTLGGNGFHSPLVYFRSSAQETLSA